MQGELVLYSDGGGEKGSSAACACIVEHPGTGQCIQLLMYLGPGTNNEAEICGGLLGYSFIALLNRTARFQQIRWVCDSEYVLKSATGYIHGWQRNGWKTADKKPVKNQSLWRVFLQLSAGLRITPEHVRGHTGHRENELCDQASTWARANAEDLFAGGGAGAELRLNGDELYWHVVDGRELIARLRRAEGGAVPDDDAFLLCSLLERSGVISFEVPMPKRTASAARRSGGLEAVLSKVQEASVLARSLEAHDARAKGLAQSLDRLVKRYSILDEPVEE